MKTTYTKRALALLLSLVVMLSMCLAGTVSAFAASGGATKMAVQPAAGTAEAEADAVSYIGAPLSGASANAQIPEYTTVNAENLNTTSTGTVYNSPGAGSYKEFTYKINMPKAGTLILRYIGINTSGAVSGSFYDSVTGSGVMSLRTSTADDGTRIREYAVSQAGTYTAKPHQVLSASTVMWPDTETPRRYQHSRSPYLPRESLNWIWKAKTVILYI